MFWVFVCGWKKWKKEALGLTQKKKTFEKKSKQKIIIVFHKVLREKSIDPKLNLIDRSMMLTHIFFSGVGEDCLNIYITRNSHTNDWFYDLF